MIHKKEHLSKEGFLNILYYYAAIILGISKKVLKLYPNIIPIQRNRVNLPLNLNPFWV